MTSAGGGEATDPATAALRRMMRHGTDDVARLHLLSAILLRKVWVATWPGSAEAVRTLTSSLGERAMPLFTGLDTLEASAPRFGWVDADGSLSSRELRAGDALRSAIASQVHFVVIDLGSEHSVEYARDEVRRVLDANANAAAAGAPKQSREKPQNNPPRTSKPPRAAVLGQLDVPFAEERTTSRSLIPEPERGREGSRRDADERSGATGGRAPPQRVASAPRSRPISLPPAPMSRREQDSMALPPLPELTAPPYDANESAAVRPSGALGTSGTGLGAVGPSPLPPTDEVAFLETPKAEPVHAEDPLAAAPSVASGFFAPEAPLPDELLRAISDVLRKYPEVEWACHVTSEAKTAVIGLRLATTFVTRSPEIVDAVTRLCTARGAAVSVLDLSDREQTREARGKGLLFYPWRRREKAK